MREFLKIIAFFLIMVAILGFAHFAFIAPVVGRSATFAEEFIRYFRPF